MFLLYLKLVLLMCTPHFVYSVGLVFGVMGGTPVWRFQPENASEWVDCSDRFIKYNISLEIPARECPLWG